MIACILCAVQELVKVHKASASDDSKTDTDNKDKGEQEQGKESLTQAWLKNVHIITKLH